MDNNTAQNNAFTYPDFSQNPQTPSISNAINNTPVTSMANTPVIDPNTPKDDDSKILEDLANQLRSLQTESQTAPQVNPVQPEPVSNTQTQEPTNTYTAQPAPLPKMEEKNAPSDFVLPDAPSPIPSNVITHDSIGVVKDTLDSIMPDAPKPKALERTPKDNNLSKPVADSEVEKDAVNVVKDFTKEDNKIFSDVAKNTNEVVDKPAEMAITDLLKYAIEHNASDLHISVGYPPIVRIDGELREVNDRIISPQDAEDLIFPILSDDKKELLEVNREIDLAYSYQSEQTARFRVNAFYTMKNLSAAFRLIPSRVRTLDELMLPQLYHQFTNLKQGLILVTGPTGHGKSTTLAAILEDINRTRFAHIVTIEDPIEYVFEGKRALIDQREMNDDTHSWTIALRSALRQDPDVILVGEMRDYETIAAAITLAETGHLVFATLHTNSASQTLERIIDVFPENQQPQIRSQLSNILEAVVAQRLIPLEKGGRRAVSEIMIANPAVRNLIREGKTSQIDNVIRTSADVGMISLEKALVNLVREGVISVKKAQEYAVYPEEVLRLLKS